MMTRSRIPLYHVMSIVIVYSLGDWSLKSVVTELSISGEVIKIRAQSSVSWDSLLFTPFIVK